MTTENLEMEVVNEPDVELELVEELDTTGGKSTASENNEIEEDTEDSRREKGQQARLSRSQKQRAARQRKDEQLEAMQAELQEMRDNSARLVAEQQRLHQLAAKFQSQALNKDIEESKRVIDYWGQEYNNAIASGDSVQIGKLNNLMNKEREKITSLEQQRQGYDTQASNINPEMVLAEQQRVNHQKSWLSKNSWFNDPRYKEERSIVESIDNQVLRDGYVSTTPAYWAELDRRIKASEVGYVQPDYEEKPSKNKPRESVPQKQITSGSGGNTAPTSSKKMSFTPTQLTALKHQGIVDQNNKPIPGKEDKLKFYYKTWQEMKGGN